MVKLLGIWVVLGCVLGLVQAEAQGWSASWGTALMQPYGTEVVPDGSFEGATLRQVVHLSTGGARVRVHVSNLFGRSPLVVTAVHTALRDGAASTGLIRVGTDRAVLFDGEGRVTIPTGAEYVSDAVEMAVAPLSDLVVTMEIAHAPAVVTLHAGARATSFLAAGSHAAEVQMQGATKLTRWYFLSGVDVAGGVAQGAVVAFGDSITDGHGATTDGNDRWPDVLARRLAGSALTKMLGVVNEGIGGNRVLEDGLGPNGVSRFAREALGADGVRYVLVLEGINDLGGQDRTAEHPQEAHDALVRQLEAAFRQMVLEAHGHGVKVMGCTLTPFVGSDYYHPSAGTEADRQRLNAWIRSSGTFDGVVDFDRAVRDPAAPERLLPAMDSGDHLHPGPAGYARMGEAISLELFGGVRK